MSIESTGRSKTERPHKQTRGLKRVIRLHLLGPYLGCTKSAVAELIKQGKLHPYSLSPGGRARVVDEDEVVRYQEEQRAKARAEAKAKQDHDAEA